MSILTPAPINFQQKVRSTLSEVLQLGYGDVIPAIVPLRVSAAASGSFEDIWRAPGDYAFVVSEIRGHVAPGATSAETTAAVTGLLATGAMRQRIVAKAINAFVLLDLPDRNGLSIVERQIVNSSAGGTVVSPLCLASLLPLAGGRPMKLVDQNLAAPLVVPANDRLHLTLTLAVNAVADTGMTEYGLDLVGIFVRARNG